MYYFLTRSVFVLGCLSVQLSWVGTGGTSMANAVAVPARDEESWLQHPEHLAPKPMRRRYVGRRDPFESASGRYFTTVHPPAPTNTNLSVRPSATSILPPTRGVVPMIKPSISTAPPPSPSRTPLLSAASSKPAFALLPLGRCTDSASCPSTINQPHFTQGSIFQSNIQNQGSPPPTSIAGDSSSISASKLNSGAIIGITLSSLFVLALVGISFFRSAGAVRRISHRQHHRVSHADMDIYIREALLLPQPNRPAASHRLSLSTLKRPISRFYGDEFTPKPFLLPPIFPRPASLRSDRSLIAPSTPGSSVLDISAERARILTPITFSTLSAASQSNEEIRTRAAPWAETKKGKGTVTIPQPARTRFASPLASPDPDRHATYPREKLSAIRRKRFSPSSSSPRVGIIAGSGGTPTISPVSGSTRSDLSSGRGTLAASAARFPPPGLSGHSRDRNRNVQSQAQARDGIQTPYGSSFEGARTPPPPYSRPSSLRRSIGIRSIFS